MASVLEHVLSQTRHEPAEMARGKIGLGDVLNLFECEWVRHATRWRVIEQKRVRGVAVGRYLSFLFESRETVLFQIQEMCRTERIIDDARIQEEIDVYSVLLPRPGELSATMMIEIADKDQIKPALDRFMGIDAGQLVFIQIGREFAVAGEFEAGHSDEEQGKLSAVHFIRFPFPAAAARAFPEAEAFLHPAQPAQETERIESSTPVAIDVDGGGRELFQMAAARDLGAREATKLGSCGTTARRTRAVRQSRPRGNRRGMRPTFDGDHYLPAPPPTVGDRCRSSRALDPGKILRAVSPLPPDRDRPGSDLTYWPRSGTRCRRPPSR